MTYPLLEKAPDHGSEEFIDFLRANNEVLYESSRWIVIANCKYDTPERRWLTAFHKEGTVNVFELNVHWGDYEWLKKPTKNQTVKRFHIHLIQPE